jgi:hypothetical protein
MSKPKESNTFDLEIPDSDEVVFDEDFQNSDVFEDYCMTFPVENLKVLPGNYVVEISNSGIGHFINQDIDVEYWIAPDAQYSTIIE